jgi:hypothetical protein
MIAIPALIFSGFCVGVFWLIAYVVCRSVVAGVKHVEAAIAAAKSGLDNSEEDIALRQLLSSVSIGAMKTLDCRVWYYDPDQKTFISVVNDDAKRTLRKCARAFGGSVRVARYDADLDEFVRETIAADTPLREIVV